MRVLWKGCSIIVNVMNNFSLLLTVRWAVWLLVTFLVASTYVMIFGFSIFSSGSRRQICREFVEIWFAITQTYFAVESSSSWQSAYGLCLSMCACRRCTAQIGCRWQWYELLIFWEIKFICLSLGIGSLLFLLPAPYKNEAAPCHDS